MHHCSIVVNKNNQKLIPSPQKKETKKEKRESHDVGFNMQ